MYPEKGMPGVVAPWNGYHTWSITLQPLRNAELLAHINQRDCGKGMLAYAMWDRACDRTHDAIAEYSWGLEQTGTTLDVTERYVTRHFPGHEKEAYRAYRLMDHAMEQRHTKKWSIPDREAISYMDLLTYRLSPYNFSYVKAGVAHPRAFLDEALCWVLTMRDEVELALSMIRYQANQAKEIFLKLAWTEGCNTEMAFRQACEAENYQVLAEDWLAILKMYDLCGTKNYSAVATIADRRYEARYELLSHWEKHKERCVAEAMGLRQQSIFMQLFRDISSYVRENPAEKLNLTEIRHLLSERSLWLR